MTDQDRNTHNPAPADQPLALRLSEGLGLAPEADLVERLRQRTLPKHGGREADSWAHHWNLTPGDSALHAEAANEIERLRADIKAMEGFADLWYFVSDEAPLQFEKIVAEYSPGRWLGEAHKLRAAKRGA